MANKCESESFYHGPKTRVLFLGEVSSAAELVAKLKRADLQKRVLRGKRLLAAYDHGYRPTETGRGRK